MYYYELLLSIYYFSTQYFYFWEQAEFWRHLLYWCTNNKFEYFRSIKDFKYFVYKNELIKKLSSFKKYSYVFKKT